MNRRTTGRFPPLSTITWLDHEERAKRRESIKILFDIISAIESGKELSEFQTYFIQKLSDSTSLDTQMNAALAAYDAAEESYIAALRAMAPYDLTAYHEAMHPEEVPAQHHIFMCKELMLVEKGETGTLLFVTPPGIAKTSYASRSFAQWFMGRNPNKRVLGVGHSQTWFEDEISKPNRDTIGSSEYAAIFPDVSLDPQDKGAHFWKLANWRGRYTARGVDANMSGIRANLILADDLYRNAKEALSPKIRAGVSRWWNSDVMPRRLPGSPIVLVNTAWHSEDVISTLERLSKEAPQAVHGPVKVIKLPAQAGKDDPLGRKEGEWLWSEFYSAQHYESLRETLDERMWAALYQCTPTDQVGEFVSQSSFQRYKKIPMNRRGEPPQWTKTVMSVDTASKGNKRSNRSCIMIFRKGVDKRHYLVDTWVGHEKMEKLVARMSSMASTWKVDYALVEDAGMGTQILENFSLTIPLIGINPREHGPKEFRFDAASKWVTSGKVVFPETSPWVDSCIAELMAFPDGAYDDQVDAFSQYVLHQKAPRRGRTAKSILTY